MMAKAIRVPAPVWSRVNAAWTLFFLVVGALNIYVAYRFSEEVWVNFKMFGIIGLTLVFVFGQAFYLSRFMDVSEENGQGN
jgi:intracellular septation protein